MNTYYSWSTKKIGNQFKAIVTKNVTRETPNENGQYCDSEIVKTGMYKSRAIAKRAAQSLVAYLNHQMNKAA